MSLRSRVLDLGYRRVIRPVLFRASGGDAERVHETTLATLARLGESRAALRALAAVTAAGRRPRTVAGIRFAGPVGLAAGMDKNGVGLRTWSALGFGHAELGTVTARPQPGNPRPRLYRLRASRGIINRMGFNNDGAEALAWRLRSAGVSRGSNTVGIPLGISIGKTKVTPIEDAAQDYLTSLRLLAPYADYIAINVSSPNTPGLRSLQDGEALGQLLRALTAEAASLAGSATPVPIFVKLAPDLTPPALDEALAVCQDAGVQGLIATNTTLARDGLNYTDLPLAAEVGGLSGAPLTRRARQVVGYLTQHTDLPVIGVGGILTADDARALLDAGASLVQVYSGYIYRGPALVSEINEHRPALSSVRSREVSDA